MRKSIKKLKTSDVWKDGWVRCKFSGGMFSSEKVVMVYDRIGHGMNFKVVIADSEDVKEEK